MYNQVVYFILILAHIRLLILVLGEEGQVWGLEVSKVVCVCDLGPYVVVVALDLCVLLSGNTVILSVACYSYAIQSRLLLLWIIHYRTTKFSLRM
jgi:hypothetical protein